MGLIGLVKNQNKTEMPFSLNAAFRVYLGFKDFLDFHSPIQVNQVIHPLLYSDNQLPRFSLLYAENLPMNQPLLYPTNQNHNSSLLYADNQK